MLPALRSRNPIRSFFDDDFFTPIFNTVFESAYKQDDDGNTILELEVPGFNKDNLNVEIADGVLTVQGETDTRKIFKKYTLGTVQDVNASIKDGILSIKLIEPEKQVKKIELKQIEQ